MPQLTRTGDVYVLDIGDTENRFHPDWLKQVGDALDEVAGAEGPRALVTAATGKFWSNGLDLDWVQHNPTAFSAYVASVHELFARMIELPVPTVAALQGHTYAAGAMLALCHDFRVMRTDRGFLCLPEVDIHIPFTPGMASLIQSRLRKQVAHELMTTGRRVGGTEALPLEIVDLLADEGEVRPAAVAIAQRHAEKASPVLGLIKSTMYETTIGLLREDVPDLHPPVGRDR